MSQGVCRACLNTGAQMRCLADEPKARQSFLDLAGVVINPDDDLPKCICKKCLKCLNEYSEFRKQIIHNNSILMESLVNVFKLKKSVTEIGEKEKKYKLKNEKTLKKELLVKQEIEVIFIQLEPEPCENDTKDYNNVNSELRLKKQKGVAVKKKSKTCSRKPATTKRTFVHVDPDQITTMTLSKEDQVRRHRERAQVAQDMPYKCAHCLRGFNYERKLTTHLVNYHKADSEYQCDVCSRTMSTAKSLKLHLDKHETVYQCNLCKFTFSEKCRAISHYKDVHEGIQPEFPCKACDKVFKNKSTLNGHVRNHHAQAEKPRCGHCGKTFISKDSFDDHMLIHTGEKNYVCATCGACFRLPHALRAHAGTHGTHGTRRTHRCARCDAPFKSRSGLNHHLKTAAAHLDANAVMHGCDICSKQFTTAYGLRRHTARHAGVRGARRGVSRVVAVCDHCGRGFTTRRTLAQHLLTHTGARPLACAHAARRHRPATPRPSPSCGKKTLGAILVEPSTTCTY